VLLVVPAEGSLDDQERLIPWVPDRYIIDVDLAAKRIEVDWDADF
jgi:16S rRNA processing protein RimM